MGYRQTSSELLPYNKCWSDPKDSQSNVIYSYQCKEVDCDEEYIGGISRTLAERYRDHLKEPFPIQVHSIQTGHNVNEDNFSILGREDWGLTRLIKESIYIRVNNSTLNRNIGKLSLSHIWDGVLYNTPGLKLNNNKGQGQIHSNRQSPHPVPLLLNHRDSLSMV